MTAPKKTKTPLVQEQTQEERDRRYQQELSAMLQREYRTRIERQGGFVSDPDRKLKK